MENEEILAQQALYEAVMYYGLLYDLKLVEEGMRDSEPLSTSGSGALKNFWNKNVVNESRRRNMRKLSEKKNEILNRIDELKARNDKAGIDYTLGEDRDALIKKIGEVFCGQNAEISKALFSLRFCLDNSVEFANRDSVNTEVSKLLFDDGTVISVLYADLKENYVKLFRSPIQKVQDTLIKCLGVSALVAVVLPPLLIGGTALTALTVPALLEGVFADICINVAVATEVAAIYSTIILGGAVIGTEIGKQIVTARAKESLRKVAPEDIGLLLALKATLIQYCKSTMTGEQLKVALDDCLKQLNDLRADAEYLLIVEKLDAEKSKKKIDICNNFTSRLVEIVGL